MKIHLLLVSFFFISTSLWAQTPSVLPSPDNRIVVLGEATVNLPADRVLLSINLTTRDSLTVQRAYDKHKQLEASLVSFLKQASIPDSAVKYQLFNVRQEFEFVAAGRRQVGAYITNQQVQLTLTNVQQYATFLVKLIGAGFTDVSADFSASQADLYQGKLLQNAVAIARRKAETLAQASGRRIKRVSKIMDTEETDPTFNRIVGPVRSDAVRFQAKAGGGQELTDIPQTISLSKQIKVVFELQ